jgi:L-seryl-tRNA(Ser) seleniumtransferase
VVDLDRDVHLRLPAVDRVLGWPTILALIEAHGRPLVLQAARDELAFLRERASACTDEGIAHGIQVRVDAVIAPSLRKVFNLTGTVLHTNLGRAPLPPEAIEAMVQVASGASNLEYDLGTGKRGDRDDHVEALLCRLTGAQAATVVNNNAAAVLLTLNSLALRREVIVSRGELIEIGGAFRLPDIMARAGCKLHEVGTTNRTHLHDFENAMGAKTALVLKAHASNYSIQGFTAQADERELGALCRERGVPFVVDLGSGTLVDLARFGLPHEPTPAQTISWGADLVTFSGDKLLGGPQAGIIVGRASLVAAIKKNPMKRAMRCDKLTIAALGAVLRLYADPERLIQQIPVLRLLARPAIEIEVLARRVQPVLSLYLGTRAQVDVVPVQSQIGSGSLPVDLLPSFAVRIKPAGPKKGAGRWLDQMAGDFRKLSTPVIGRITDGAFLLDLRCLEDEAGFLAMFATSQR